MGPVREELLLTLPTLRALAASPKRVHLLNSLGRGAGPSLAEPEGQGPLVAFMEGRVKNHSVDLYLSIGGRPFQNSEIGVRATRSVPCQPPLNPSLDESGRHHLARRA